MIGQLTKRAEFADNYCFRPCENIHGEEIKTHLIVSSGWRKGAVWSC